MRWVDINVHLLAKTELDKDSVRTWLDGIGATECPVENSDVISDPEYLTGLSGKRCYNAFQVGMNPNITKVRKDWGDYFDNILKSGHGSVLEHMNFTFAFENVSRVFTGEMNRHRAGTAISEGSMRYIRYTDIPMWMPTSIRPDLSGNGQAITDQLNANGGNPDLFPGTYCPAGQESACDEYKKPKTRHILRQTVKMIERSYRELVELWDFDSMKDFHQKKQITSMIRRIIPMGVATGGVWTMNGRAIRHIVTMRASDAAEEEILYVFSRVAKIMCQAAPLLFKDFKETPEGFWVPEHSKV